MIAEFAVWTAGTAAVFFAVLMVLQTSLYASAVCLLMVLLQAAVLFYASGAKLLAFLQVIIYAGAVMVLIVIAIAASREPREGEGLPGRWGRLSLPWPAAVAGLALPPLEVLALMSRSGLPEGGLGGAAAVEAGLGGALFGPYAVATEAVTLLLLLASLALVERGRAPR